jgi:hypothetical protein
MSYYILPKNANNINVNPKFSREMCSPCISCSLVNYYNLIKQQIFDIFTNNYDLSDNSFDCACKLINPYEFIFSRVPGSKFTVSKLKPKTNLFYDLVEMSSNLNILDSFKILYPIKFLHVTNNYNDSIECFEMLRDNYPDEHFYIENFNLDDNKYNEIKFDFLFYETTSSNYFISLVHAVVIILRNQNFSGTSIIKIGDAFHKPVIDVLYLLSSLYDKVYICKPNTNNIVTFDRYIVCKNFLHNKQSNNYLRLNYLNLVIFLKKIEDNNVVSILDFPIPYFYKNKIDDINIIIGQQQIEAFDQIISVYKNKNKNDKIEFIKKNNIQKSVSWCEKYKIPCNKFSEKTNIFLPIINETT